MLFYWLPGKRGGVGLLWAPQKGLQGLQAYVFAEEYVKWPGATLNVRINIIKVMNSILQRKYLIFK